MAPGPNIVNELRWTGGTYTLNHGDYIATIHFFSHCQSIFDNGNENAKCVGDPFQYVYMLKAKLLPVLRTLLLTFITLLQGVYYYSSLPEEVKGQKVKQLDPGVRLEVRNSWFPYVSLQSAPRV